MSLFHLPNEIIFQMAGFLRVKDLNSLLRSNHFLHILLTPLLHKFAVRDVYGLPALCWAARNGYEPLVRLLFEKGGADSLGLQGRTREADYAKTSSSLFDYGDDYDYDYDFSVDSAGPGTPLGWAAQNGHASIVAFLVRNGADTTAIGVREAPLISPARYGHDEVLAVLLDSGVDVNSESENRQSAISIAAQLGHGSTVKLLLERGANIEGPMEDGEQNSALYNAARGGHLEILLMLLDHGYRNWDNGEASPLVQAAYPDSEDMVNQPAERGDKMVNVGGPGHKGGLSMMRTLLDLGRKWLPNIEGFRKRLGRRGLVRNRGLRREILPSI